MKKIGLILTFMLAILISGIAQTTPPLKVPKATTVLVHSYQIDQQFYLSSVGKTYIAVATTTAGKTFQYLIDQGQVTQYYPDYYVLYTTVTQLNYDSTHMVAGDTLLVAPGSGKYIHIIDISAEITVNGSGAWDVGSQTGKIGWGDGTSFKYNVPNADLENATGTIISNPVSLACKPEVNKPLIFILSATTKASNAYHPTIKWHIFYKILTL